MVADNIETLEEYNKRRREEFMINSSLPRPNGIVCSQCGTELMDSNPMVVLASYPPLKEVICSFCGYEDYRVA